LSIGTKRHLGNTADAGADLLDAGKISLDHNIVDQLLRSGAPRDGPKDRRGDRDSHPDTLRSNQHGHPMPLGTHSSDSAGSAPGPTTLKQVAPRSPVPGRRWP